MGERASNRVRSGVIVREAGPCCGLSASIAGPELPGLVGAVGVGVDQANEGWEDWDAAFAGAASQPVSIALTDAPRAVFPFTRLSKSISVFSDPPFDWKAFVAPNDINSSFPLPFVLLVPESSESFFVRSASTREDKFLISSMKAWNCLRSNKGPKLMPHRTGRISSATKSSSATLPIWRRTFRAAILTAGSLVLMPLIKGRIFSCIVYLSRAVELLFLLMLCVIPSSPSLLDAGSFEPPQRVTKASNPRTLIARLLVLLNTLAMMGNSSFLIVEKSSTGRMTGRLRKEASTIVWVGDSMARIIMGSISGIRSVIESSI